MGRTRVKIGLVYSPTSDWIAGAYYVQNLVKTLKAIDSRQLPIVKVFCQSDKEFEEFKRETGYPYLEKRLFEYYSDNSIYNSLIWRYKRYVNRNYGEPRQFPLPSDDVLFVYPFTVIDNNRYSKGKCLGWVPDFQEKYLPELFSVDEIESRNQAQNSFISNNVPLVFSSNDARNDFLKFHPEGKGLKTFILQFAVSHPNFSSEDIVALKKKFGIRKQYLFCANQFWAHKNHLFLFKVFKEAREKGLDLQLVCSGKLSDYRNNEYAGMIKSFIYENHLQEDIILTGFIERKEQLCLMKNSYAVIQPSLFEGWSTVVEDSKCLNKFIYLSDLRVHREQVSENVCFFNPRKEDDLLNKFLTVKPTVQNKDYRQNVENSANQFMDIIRYFKEKM